MLTIPLETIAGKLLNREGLRLAVAESCTGGLIGHRLTNVPGSSNYFAGGVIAYANEIKTGLLGVRPETLARYGAVSEQTVLEMARGVRSLMKTDIALSVSGIAGPDGGTSEKPVGLVWIGLSAGPYERAESQIFSGDRLAVKEQAAGAVLQILVNYLEVGSGEDLPAVTSEWEAGEAVQATPAGGEKSKKVNAIDVTVRFDSQGKAIPLQFSWKGRDYQVDSTGRRWQDEAGQHILVMVPGGRVFEMLFAPAEGRWYLLRTGERRKFV